MLHSSNPNDGLVLRDPIPSCYQPQHSLVYLRICVRDFASIKCLLMFLPGLVTLGKTIIAQSINLKESKEN